MVNHPYAGPDDSSRPAPKKKEDFQFPLWAIIMAFVVWWPLGLVFLGLNWVIREGKLDLSASQRPEVLRSGPAAAQRGTPIYAQTPPPQPKAASRPAEKPKKKQSSAGMEVTLAVVGVCLLFAGAVALPEGLMWLTDALQEGGHYWAYLVEDSMAALGMLAGGVGCLFSAGKIKASRRMRKKLKNIVGTAKYCHIEDIAAAIPCDYAKCCRYLEDAIDKGDFGPHAYLDMRTRCLVVEGEAPKPEPAPAPKPAAAPSSPADPYQTELEELRRLNEDIDDAELSEKISRLEAVSARIFSQARTNPDKLPQMRRFLDYYLPTAQKLLKTYAELEAQGIEGENITESKTRIANAMDTLVTAFENQLDKLFQSDALDVSTDIDVMEHMLRADGLAEDPFGLGAPPSAPELK